MKTYKRRGSVLRIDAEDGYFGGERVRSISISRGSRYNAPYICLVTWFQKHL